MIDPRGREFLFTVLPKNAICVEVGVWKGDFSSIILRQSNPKRLHLIDQWKYVPSLNGACFGQKCQGKQAEMDKMMEGVKSRFAKEVISGQVVIHRGDSVGTLAVFPDNYFDWAYLDADHRAEFVEKDLGLLIRKVKPGGYIAGDDYGVLGWWGNGVSEGVVHFIDKNPKVTEWVAAQWEQFVLKRK